MPRSMSCIGTVVQFFHYLMSPVSALFMQRVRVLTVTPTSIILYLGVRSPPWLRNGCGFVIVNEMGGNLAADMGGTSQIYMIDGT